MRFSHCGQLLATAGQDKNIMIWVVKDSYDHFKGNDTRVDLQFRQFWLVVGCCML